MEVRPNCQGNFGLSYFLSFAVNLGIAIFSGRGRGSGTGNGSSAKLAVLYCETAKASDIRFCSRGLR